MIIVLLPIFRSVADTSQTNVSTETSEITTESAVTMLTTGENKLPPTEQEPAKESSVEKTTTKQTYTRTSQTSVEQSTVEQSSDDTSSKTDSQWSPFGTDLSECDLEGNTGLTSLPISIDSGYYILPMGKIAASGHITPTDHWYFRIDIVDDNLVDILSPASGYIVKISSFPDEEGIGDYRMIIEHSCTLFTYYIHLREIDPAILKETGEISPNKIVHKRISVDSGQTVGKVGPLLSYEHVVGNTNLDFANFNQSNLEVDIQKTSNDTYLKVHGIDSDLIKNENLLTSKVELDLINENYFFNLKTQAVEDLTKNNDKYEYTLPFYHFGKELSYFTNYGSLNLDSQGYFKNYDTNKKEKLIVNDLLWSSINSYTANGFMNNFDVILKNTNYSSDNISDLKSEKQNHELSGALAFTSSLPLRKTTSSSTKLLTPKIMFRTAPGHMNSLKDQDLRLDYSNLFSINKASNIRTVENGNSIAFGTSYLNQDNQKNANKFEANIGQVFTLDTNKDMPTKSTLNRKMSDLVGDIIWKVDENNLKYKFSLDHNYSELNYQEVSSKLSLNKLVTEFSFIEERNVIGSENFLDTKINFEIDNTNSLNFSTRKNFKTDMTEFYNLMYEYENDCLIASIEYNRQFYTDRDIEPTNNLMFMIKFLPFGTIKSPSFGK